MNAGRIIDKLIFVSTNKKGKRKKYTRLKTMIYSDQVESKRLTLALVSETLKLQRTFEELLRRLKEEKEVDLAKTVKNKGLLYVLLYDQLVGRGVKGGGAIKRKIFKHLAIIDIVFKDIQDSSYTDERCPYEERYSCVRGVLVDPSCSGSGIRERLETRSSGSNGINTKRRLQKLNNFQYIKKKMNSFFLKS